MNSKNSTRISASELEIMTVLWNTESEPSGMPASTINQQLSTVKKWSPRTVNTMLARLVSKNILESVPDGRRYLYRPLISKQEYTDRSAGSLIDRLFDGRTAPLVAHLVKTRGLSEDEMQEIQDLLERMKKQSKGAGE